MPASSSTPGIVLSEIAAIMPQPSPVTPVGETVGGNAGSNPARFAQEGHQHPRLTSTTYATLDNIGQAAVLFTRSFTNKPGLVVTEVDANVNDQPLVVRGVGWTKGPTALLPNASADAYTGCTIKGSRAQILPTIAGVSGLLTAVITGVNAITASLTNFNIFGGIPTGAVVSVIAIVRSDMPA